MSKVNGNGHAPGLLDPSTNFDAHYDCGLGRHRPGPPTADEREQERDEPLKDFPLTDAGNGELIMDDHDGVLKFVPPWKKWITFMSYEGGHWRVDESGAANRLALCSMRRLKKLGAQLAQSDDERLQARGMKLLKHAINCEADRKLKAALSQAATVEGASIMPDKLDTDPWQLNVLNGTIDLKTGKLRPHMREDFITKLCPVNFDPTATCPVFESFVDEIFGRDREVIGFTQRAIGYSATGITIERALFILYGTGANGKSTLLGIIRELLGSYAMQTAADTLMAKRNEGIPNDIARLQGARFVPATETDEGRHLAEGLLKRMTGGEDVLTARFLFGEHFDFRPAFKLWLGTNHKPIIRGTDQAIWDRLRLIPFNVRIAEKDRDKALPDKLRAELPGILNWVIAGCLAWQRDGLGTATAITEAGKDYKAEMDTLAEFIADSCDVGTNLEVAATALYDRYKLWAVLNKEEPLSQTKFGRQLSSSGYESSKGSDGLKTRKGIAIKASKSHAPDGYGQYAGTSSGEQ